MRKKSESSEQIALVSWAWYQKRLSLIHYPSELLRFLNPGQKIHQLKLGTKVGMPDLFLFEPRLSYHGLVIEMKSCTGSVTEKQSDWLAYFTCRGYKTAVCRSFEEAKELIEAYVNYKMG